MDLSLFSDPVYLLQNLIDGLSRGALYAVYAMGLTLIFGVLDIINLAHAATFMWCAVAGWGAMAVLGLPLAAGLLAAMLTGAALALALEFVGFRPLRREGADRLATMISSIGLSLILVSVAEALFGVETRRFPSSVLSPRPYRLAGVRISPAQILIIAASLALMAAMGWFIRRTRMGKAIRAIAADPKAARLLGIPVEAVIAATFATAGALAGAAGILVGLLTNNIVPDMGGQIQLRGLAVVILGGMGNMEGAVLGGLILGVVETFSIAYLPGGSDIKDAVVFLILFLILVVRPNGLLGRNPGARA